MSFTPSRPPAKNKNLIVVPRSHSDDSLDALTDHALFLESHVQALTDEKHRLGTAINDMEAEYTFLEGHIKCMWQEFKNTEENLEEEIAELEFDACYLKNKVQGLRVKNTRM